MPSPLLHRIHPHLTALGVALVLGGALLLWAQQPVQAQASNPLAEADYIGADECASCHRDLARTHDDTWHALALQDTGRRKEAILGDFALGEALRQVQFPEADAPRAFTADDIAFAIGSGRNVQRYLYEVDNNEYRVLPAEWVVATGEWRALSLAASWDDPAYDWEASCAACHTTGFEVERGRWQDDGVQCEACHGPGELHEELASDAGRNPNDEELVGIRAAIHPAVDAQACGQCHSRGVGAEGQAFPVGFIPGSPLSDGFALSTADQADHWWVSGHASQANMQYNEWLASGHASALSTLQEAAGADASCLSCHSSDYAINAQHSAAVAAGDREGSAPAPLSLAEAHNGVSCVSCHNSHPEDGPSSIPAAESVYGLCTSCHANTAEGVHHPTREMFEGLAFVDGQEAVAGAHFSADDGPTCASCHMPSVPINDGTVRASHTFEPVLSFGVAGLPDSCSECHQEQASPQAMDALIQAIQSDTRARLDAARAALGDSTPAWVTQALDFVEGDGSLGIHNVAYTDALLDAVEAELSLVSVSGGQ